MRTKSFAGMFLFLALFFVTGSLSAKESMDPPPIPSLLSALQLPRPAGFCREPVPWEDPDIVERYEKEFMLALQDRVQVILWIKRSGRYFNLIEEKLSSERMPSDLKYVAVIESALRPHARSSRGAVGYWQFMPETGRKFGLSINRYIDERRSIEDATDAAIRYFKELHQLFGSWTLAAAGFNMGEKGLSAEIEVQKSLDYYSLHLPIETQRFLFRILAAKAILSDPEKFGFHLPASQLYRLPAHEEIEIVCDEIVSLMVVAEAAKTSFKRIKDLNPQIRGHYLGPGITRIHIPAGARGGFDKRYEALLKKYREARHNHIYVVRPGDNLSSIAERFDIPLAVLIIWNQLNITKPIYPGDRLVIHRNLSVAEEVENESENVN